jgi:nucleoside-diphosphate-sugar epimerase
VNVIWQGDANSLCLRSFAHCQSPPLVLNITGTAALAVREIALDFGRHFGIEPEFVSGAAGTSSLLSDVTKANGLFGTPKVSPDEMIAWIADWIQQGSATLDKPTQFQTRDGRF